MAIFLGDERLITPRLEGDDEDRILLKNLRMFCRLLKIRRGLSELIIPKKLARIDLVRVSRIFQVETFTHLKHFLAR